MVYIPYYREIIDTKAEMIQDTKHATLNLYINILTLDVLSNPARSYWPPVICPFSAESVNNRKIY